MEGEGLHPSQAETLTGYSLAKTQEMLKDLQFAMHRLHAAVDRSVRVPALEDVPDEHRQTSRYEILAGHPKFFRLPPPVANHVVVSADGTYLIIFRRCYKESFVLVTQTAVP